jgi:hypothetical protein
VRVDVTATSRDGDTALHYLVRAKSRQPDTVHYYKLLKTILGYVANDGRARVLVAWCECCVRAW